MNNKIINKDIINDQTRQYERVTKVWYDLMEPEEYQKVVETMPKRIKQCIKNKGRWTDY
jgi:hypothetical protein